MDITELFDLKPTLHTERLILRTPMIDDAQDMFECASEPDVARYVTFERCETLEDSRALLERITTAAQGTGRRTWGVEERASGKMLGTCGIFLDSANQARAEVGYMLNKAYWGRGYITEAVKAVIEYGFTTLNLHRIQALCYIDNAASVRVMEKAGMSYEGILRGYRLTKNAYPDVKIYAILREDWEQQQ